MYRLTPIVYDIFNKITNHNHYHIIIINILFNQEASVSTCGIFPLDRTNKGTPPPAVMQARKAIEEID